MTTLNKALLTLAVEGFVQSTYSQEQLDESLVYSDEGWKGTMKGFLLTAGSTLAGGLVGGAVGGPLGMLLGSSAAMGAARAAQADKLLRLQKDIQVIAKRITQIQKGAIDKAKAQGVEVPPRARAGMDVAVVIANGVTGTLSGLLGPFFKLIELGIGTAYGHEIEKQEELLAKKIRELKREFRKAGIEVPEDDEDD